MRRPFWLMITAVVLVIGLIVNQIIWVVKAADEQEKQFNSKVELAMTGIEDGIGDDNEVCSSLEGCLIVEQKQSCGKFLKSERAWRRTDSIVSAELRRFDIELDYEFDFCYEESLAASTTIHTQDMERVFNEAGIIFIGP